MTISETFYYQYPAAIQIQLHLSFFETSFIKSGVQMTADSDKVADI